MHEPTTDDGVEADERDSSDQDERQPLADRLVSGPIGGGVLLTLGSAVLTWQVVAAFERTAALWNAPLGVGALLGVLALAGMAALAQLRPDYATETGIASVFVAVSAVTLLLVSPGELATPDRLFLGLLVGSAGGALCVGWQPGATTTSLRQSPALLQIGRLAVVVGLATIVVVNAGPAAVSAVTVDPTTRTQETATTLFPQSVNQSGGFVVSAGLLEAGYYDYDPDCDLFADCPDLTVDSSRRDSVQVARMRLDSRHGNDLLAEDFLIYKNFYLTEELKDQYLENETLQEEVDAIHFRMAADNAVATGTDDGRALDIYASEVYIAYLAARFDLVEFIDWDPRVDEIVNYWTCRPDETEGWGTINDDRLGVSVDPRLDDGRDVRQLTHQLGSTETVLYNFELEIGTGAIDKRATGVAKPDNCP